MCAAKSHQDCNMEARGEKVRGKAGAASSLQQVQASSPLLITGLLLLCKSILRGKQMGQAEFRGHPMPLYIPWRWLSCLSQTMTVANSLGIQTSLAHQTPSPKTTQCPENCLIGLLQECLLSTSTAKGIVKPFPLLLCTHVPPRKCGSPST